MSPTRPASPSSRRLAWSLLPALLGALATAAAEAPPATEWVSRYSGLGNGNNQVTAMALDARGCIYVTGYSGGAWWDMATVKCSPSGRQLWVARYDGPAGGDDVPSAIAVDPRGYVVVAGYTDGNGRYNYDFITIQYDSTLTRRWVRTYAGQGNPGLDEAMAVAVDAAGNVYATGFSYQTATGNDYVTIKYDADGAPQWTRRYNGPGNQSDGGNAVAVDGDGNVYVTGISNRSPGAVNNDVATLKYDAAGAQQWVARYNGPGDGNDSGIALRLDAARNVYVAGYSTGIGSYFDCTTIKYDDAGHESWVRRYDGARQNDAALALALDGAANVYVTGYVVLPGTAADYATLVYDTDGAPRWVATYNGPVDGYDEGQSIALDAAGNVYVTGYSDGGTGTVDYDYATVKYDPSGAEAWAVRYDGTGSNIDVAVSVALDAAERVVVSGWSTGTHGNDVDFTTIAYDQVGSAGLSAAERGPDGLRLIVSPNPFRDSTTLRFVVPRAAPAELALFDAAGRAIATPLSGPLAAGGHSVRMAGSGLDDGVYFYRLRVGAATATGRIVRRE